MTERIFILNTAQMGGGGAKCKPRKNVKGWFMKKSNVCVRGFTRICVQGEGIKKSSRGGHFAEKNEWGVASKQNKMCMQKKKNK